MLISSIFVRFYRSFNYDYLRKAHQDSSDLGHPWDVTAKGQFYPFVEVPLERGITTVVGANESGKSQLLSAIRAALTGEDIARGDFCRYSQFFAVGEAMTYPDFGLQLKDLTEADLSALMDADDLDDQNPPNSVAIFRFGNAAPVAYVLGESGWELQETRDIKPFLARLPKAFKIHADVPLPDSVPILFLKDAGATPQRSRSQRRGFFSIFQRPSTNDPETEYASARPDLLSAFGIPSDPSEIDKLRLADDLLCRVAGVDRSAFEELYFAISSGNEGYANGIVDRVNRALAVALNFPKWWSQDHHFQLLVSLRDLDLVFTIRDRTGTEYSFGERSGGLKYFLSYFVQYLSHVERADGQAEILLMDEPDAYLSSAGQQDLLRVFDGFAYPEGDKKACQVVYVTHSPFLIDKNHGERLRVLEKGEGDEGSRVVKNAARNHYEPLRSAFGGFVGETTFISNCNLVVEGTSDQIMLAGMSARLRGLGVPATENIDLNTLTLVPAGSASHVPYLVFLARGRDEDRPAVIVLLDGDEAGDEARKVLRKGGPRGKTLLNAKYVVQISDIQGTTPGNPTRCVDLEDLVPLSISVEAGKRYVEQYLEAEKYANVRDLSIQDIVFDEQCPGTYAALVRAIASKVGDDFHLDKVGFARHVVEIAGWDQAADSGLVDAQALISDNFRKLFAQLAKCNVKRIEKRPKKKRAQKSSGYGVDSCRITRMQQRVKGPRSSSRRLTPSWIVPTTQRS